MNNPADATAAAQKSQQQQAEQYAQQQQANALASLQQYLKSTPNPASQWGPIQGPNMSNMPGQIGGGTTNAQGGLTGALAGWKPGATPPVAPMTVNPRPLQPQAQAQAQNPQAQAMRALPPGLQNILAQSGGGMPGARGVLGAPPDFRYGVAAK